MPLETEILTKMDTQLSSMSIDLAKFTTLPMEILIMIAETLFIRYKESRPKDTVKWGRMEFNGPLDKSFFAARRINKKMRDATRKAFFGDKDLAVPWLLKGIEAMEQRIDLEEKYAEDIAQLFCGMENRLMRIPQDQDDTFDREFVDEVTGWKFNDVHRRYAFAVLSDPEMLFKKGFRLRTERATTL